MISAEGIMQQKFNDHGTTKLSFPSHSSQPFENLKSRSLQSFETKKPVPQKSSASRVKSGHPIHVKRRDQILENFIKETEERYKKHTSRSKASPFKGSEIINKNVHAKSVRFSSNLGNTNEFKIDTPRSTISCDSDSKNVSSEDEYFQGKPDISSKRYKENVAKSKTSSPYLTRNDSETTSVSPGLSRTSTNMSPYPKTPIQESTETEQPQKITIRRSRSYKQAVSAPVTQYGVSQSAEKSRLKSVLKDLSKRKRQVHIECSTAGNDNNKNSSASNLINDDTIKTSQSSIINFTNDPKGKHYTSANVCSSEVEECSDNRNTLVVDYDANSGHNSIVDPKYNKSNFSKASLVKSVNSSNDWSTLDTGYNNTSNKLNIRRLHRKQQSDSLDNFQTYQNESSDFNSKEEDWHPNFQDGNYNVSVNQNLDRNGKSNFPQRGTVNENEGVPIHTFTGCENKGLSRIDINNDKTVKINRDCASEGSFKDIDPKRSSHLSRSNQKQVDEFVNNNCNVLDNYINGKKESVPIRKLAKTESEKVVLKNEHGVNKISNKAKTTLDKSVDGSHKDKLIVDNKRDEFTNRKTDSLNKGVNINDNDSGKARSSPYYDDLQNTRKPSVSRDKAILSDKLKSRTDSVSTNVITPRLDKRQSLKQSRLQFDTTETDINEIEQHYKTSSNDHNLTNSRLDYCDNKSSRERGNLSTVLPNKGILNSTKDIRFKSKSHDSFHDKPNQVGASSSSSKDTVPVATATVKPPPVKSGSTQLTGLSSRSVYLSSKSCVNFAKFDKNDFKAALKKLKVSSNSKSSSSSSSAPQPVTYGSKSTVVVGDKYPSTLYEIGENNANQKGNTLHEYHENNATLPDCAVDTHIAHSVETKHTDNLKNRISPKTRPYLATKSQVLKNTAGPLPTMKSDNQKSTMQTMPSYTANPLKMRQNISTSSLGNNAMLKSKSHDTFSRSDKQIDVGLMSFQQPSPQPRRRIGPRAHLQSKSNVNIATATSMQVDQKPPLDRTQERPKTGRGRRRPVSPNEYFPSETESVSLFSETCSTVSDHSENIMDEHYVGQHFSTFSKSNTNTTQSTVVPRPKSSKGRSRIPNHGQSENGMMVESSGSIMESAPWISSQNMRRSRNTTTTVFNMKNMSNSPANEEQYQKLQNASNSDFSYDKKDTSSKVESVQKARPKSAKGRARDLNKVKKTDAVRQDDLGNRNIEHQLETVAKQPRPKSSKGRVRNIDVPQASTNTDTVAHTNLRPKSAKGKVRDGPLPTQSLPSSQFTNVRQHTKTVLSIDSMPNNHVDKQNPLERKQQRRHISSFQNLQSYNSEQPMQRKPQKYFKPQTSLDIDSGNDTDFDGEIEVLDLDDLDDDSDDFIVDKPVFINGTIDGTMTNSSRSSRGSSDTSAAWDNVNVNHHNNKMPPRHYNNKSVYDACPPDTPRLTPKEVAIMKSQHYEQINKNNSAMTAAANHNSSGSFAKNNEAASTSMENNNMQTDKKSPVGHVKYGIIDPLQSRLKGSDALKSKQYPSDIYTDANSLDEKAISKYRQRELSNPSFVHDNFQNIATPHMSSNNKTNVSAAKPRKLKPIYQHQKLRQNFSYKEKSGNNLLTDSYYYENCERNVNNCNASNGIGGANTNSHAMLAGIHTKAQKARKNKPKKIEKLTIVHGDADNVENQFDSSFYSDSPGYITDGSLSFEYHSLSHRRMSDKS